MPCRRLADVLYCGCIQPPKRSRDTVKKRIGSLLLAVVLLTSLLPLPASAAVSLPGDLLVIEDEAFLGVSALGGLVQIPWQVTAIGQRAFQNTKVYALEVCEEMATIGADALAGTGATYLYLNGADAAVDPSVYDDVKYVLGRIPDNVPAGVVCVPEEELALVNGFYYRLMGSEAQLLFPRDTGEIPTTLYIPDTADGLKVTSVSEAAFTGCEGVQSIDAPAWLELTGTNLGVCAGATVNYRSETIPATPADAFVFASNGDGTCTVTDYTGTERRITIPAMSPEGEAVVAVGTYAFSISEITHAVLPEGIIHIEPYAFMAADQLVFVQLPSTLETIGDGAFLYCYQLAEITIPDGVTSLPYRAFEMCSSLRSIHLPNTLTSIESSALGGCNYLSPLILPDHITFVGRGIHPAYYSNRTEVLQCTPGSTTAHTLSDAGYTFTVEGQPDYLLYHNSSDLLTLDKYTGADAVIALPEGIQAVDGYAIPNHVTGISLPKSVQYLYDNAFDYAWKLSSFTAEEGLLYIGKVAFHCTMDRITLPASVTTIASTAFWYARIGEFELPPGIRSIGKDAFYTDALLICEKSSATAQQLAKNDYTFTSPGELDFRYKRLPNTTTIQLISYLGNEAKVEVPWGVTEIGAGVFAGNTTMTSIALPQTVTTIHDYAFRDCTALEEVLLPSSLTTVKYGVFSGCTKLEQVQLPRNLITYSGSSAVLPVVSPGSAVVETISVPFVFYGYEDFLLSRSNGEIILNAYTGDDTEIHLPELVPQLKAKVFYELDADTAFYLHDNVSFIGANAFPAGAPIYCTPGSVTDASLKSAGYKPRYTEDEENETDDVNLDSYLSGTVLSADGEPLEGVAVTHYHTADDAWTIYTDKNGCWTYECDGEGWHTVEYALAGYTFWPESDIFHHSSASVQSPVFRAYALSEGETLPALAAPVIYAPDNGDVLLSDTVTIRWNTQETANYSWSVAQIKGGGTTSVRYTTVASGDGYVTLTLPRGFSYRFTLKAYRDGTTLKTYTEFTIAADLPAVEAFTMSSNEVLTCQEVTFVVTAPDVTEVQLLVDGVGYDTRLVGNDGTVTFSRSFTMAGERRVAFRGCKSGVWSEACPEQILTVSASQTLPAPTVALNGNKYSISVQTGTPVTVSWNAVENADGYALHLIQPDGSDLEARLGAETLSYDIEAELLSQQGNYTVLVMPFGMGYSQGEGSRSLTVEDFIPWSGWPQSTVIDLFALPDASSLSGYLDRLSSLSVLGQEGDFYLVSYNYGTKQGYVRVSDVGTTQYKTQLTLTPYYKTQDGKRILSLVTTGDAVSAGVAWGDVAQSTTRPDEASSAKKIFRFEVEALTVDSVWDVWVEDLSGERVETQLAVPAYVPEATPAPTAVPGTTGAPAVTPTPPATPTPTPKPTATPTAAPAACPFVEEWGQHASGCLEDVVLTGSTSGTLTMNSARCAFSGENVVIPLPDISLRWKDPLFGAGYYHNDPGYGTLVLDYKQLNINNNLRILRDADFGDATLVVTGELRVSANLRCGSIVCSSLVVEDTGSITMTQGSSLKLAEDGGSAVIEGSLSGVTSMRCDSLTIKENGSLSFAANGSLTVDGTLLIKGQLTGSCKTIQCTHLTVEKDGQLGLQSGGSILVSLDFLFKSDRSHRILLPQNSTIKIGMYGSVTVKGSGFHFEGTLHLNSNSILIKMNDAKSDFSGNYIGTLVYPSALYVYSGGQLNPTWNAKSTYVAKQLNASVVDYVSLNALHDELEALGFKADRNGNYDLRSLPEMVNKRLPKRTDTGKVDSDYYYDRMLESNQKELDISDAAEALDSQVILATATGAVVTADDVADYGMAYLLHTNHSVRYSDYKAGTFAICFSTFTGGTFTYNNQRYSLEPGGAFGMKLKDLETGSIMPGSTYFTGTLYRIDPVTNKRENLGIVTYVPSAKETLNACRTLIELGKQELDAALEVAYDELIGCAEDALGLSSELLEPMFRSNLEYLINVVAGDSGVQTFQNICNVKDVVSTGLDEYNDLMSFRDLANQYLEFH